MSSSTAVSVTTSAGSSSSSAAAGAISAPKQFKVVGVILAVLSGLLIGSSFVFKKKGLLRSQKGHVAGEGVAYLKSPLWWVGMTMMILGELCNFVAYAFVEAVVVTPLGALSVVICAILSSLFLNEKLTFFGWLGCALCIIGSTTIALNGPQEQTVGQILAFQKLFLAPGFLAWAGVLIGSSLSIIIYFGPRHGTKSMFWYIFVCSMIGGLSVSCTTGLGASIVTSIQGDNQFKHWFIYFLLIFVSITLVTEVLYLNKALALFNTAMVTPTYYVIFTFFTLVTSVILFQGLKSSATQILTILCGFLTICVGITVLQMSKVDPTELNRLDRKSTILLQASRRETESAEKSLVGIEDPGMDALRGSFGTVGSIIRARSAHRMSMSSKAGRPHARTSHNGGQPEGSLSRPDSLGSQLPGIGNFKRHQLYDPPVPKLSAMESSDAISLKSDLGTGNNNLQTPDVLALSKSPRTPTIKFESQDVAHYYPQPGAKGGSRHEHVQAATGEGHHIIRDGPLPPLPPPTPNSMRHLEQDGNITPRAHRLTPQTAPASHFTAAHSNAYIDPFNNGFSAPQPAPVSASAMTRFPPPPERREVASSQNDSPSKKKPGKRSKSGQRHYPKSGGEEDEDESVNLVDREGGTGHVAGYVSSSESDTNPGESSIRLVSSKTRI